MSIIPKLLKSRQRFPKPEANWRFGDFSKIQAGAGPNDVAGWTGESLKAGLATVDLTQSARSSQPAFDTDHIVFDGNDFLDGASVQSGNFTYIMKFMSTSDPNQMLFGSSTIAAQHIALISVGNLRYRSSSLVNHDFPLIYDNTGPHTIAIVKDGNDIIAYNAGLEIGTATDTGSVSLDRIGGRTGGSAPFIGNIYNTLIYPEALDATEVAAITASLA